MQVQCPMNRGFGDFGRNIFTPITNIVTRATKQIITPVRMLTQGNIKGAARGLLDLNPTVFVTKVLTKKEKIINMARVIIPASVINITDRDLRKKAAIGYAAVAVVATAAFAATAGSAVAATASGGTAAAGAGAGATTAGTIGAGIKAADKIADLAKKKKQQGEPEYEEEQNQFLAGMITPQNILLFVGLSALTAAGYMLFSGPKNR